MRILDYFITLSKYGYGQGGDKSDFIKINRIAFYLKKAGVIKTPGSVKRSRE